ncbi:DUF4199 family protein [Rudanella paleaurantiibacter]|uniref:DUF4199 family protein n=1 Tax=Rudanella paleaurantiibacter TaxID=2614655 RepID=A0A7J5U512_9BACT|nr:DUF4199 domain-containing protein [Rudanella paleaurantiibacter]KAB7732677.1 DUF4199 family protein [Rudanella paleaurantiibacter]
MSAETSFFSHPLLRVPLIAGAATGALAIAYLLVLYVMGVESVLYVRSMRPLDFGFYLIAMGTTLWYYRKYINGGLLHLWEGLTICYVINVVAALLTGWFIYLFISFVDADLFTRYIADLLKFQTSDKAAFVKQFSEEAFAAQIAKTKATQPAELIWDELLKKSLMTVFPALILSLIFRKQDYSIMNPG